MTNFELEDYIKNNIEKIIQDHIKMLSGKASHCSFNDLVKMAEELMFIKNFVDKKIEIRVLDVKDYIDIVEEKINQDIPE